MTRVKICGLRDVEHVRVAIDAGADAVGFVLAASPRRVTPEEAARLLDVAVGVVRVAVVRAPTDADVAVVNALPFDAMQGEGARPAGLAPDRRWIPAFRNDADIMARVPASAGGPHWLDGAVLLDGPGDAGAGVVGDWERAGRLARRVPVLLAGGLNPENVADAVRVVRPLGVDVSSGVERERGEKDVARIRAFVDAVRGVAP
jgi:phosphoribosylanthranilate isomerase